MSQSTADQSPLRADALMVRRGLAASRERAQALIAEGQVTVGGTVLAKASRRLTPDADIRVSEQNGPDDTFGFGVVFSDTALDFLKADDPETHDLITPRMERWRNMTLSHAGDRVTLDGIGFAAIGRLELQAANKLA